MTHHQKSITAKGKTYSLNIFYNYSSKFVAYCVTCPCVLLYVGHTIRILHKRFGEHKRSIEDDSDLTIPKYFKAFHQSSVVGPGGRVWVVEQISRTLSVAEHFKHLCEREMFWIYTLDVLAPGGLNKGLGINYLL